MYIGIAVDVSKKLHKEDVVLLGDVRNLLSSCNDVYLVKRIKGKAIGTVQEGSIYKKEDIVFDGPLDVTEIESIKILLDLGLIQHEDMEGEFNLLYKLVENRSLPARTFSWLYNDARKNGFLYNIEELKKKAASLEIKMHAYSLVKY